MDKITRSRLKTIKECGFSPYDSGGGDSDTLPYVLVVDTNPDKIYKTLCKTKHPPLCVSRTIHEGMSYTKIEWSDIEDHNGCPVVIGAKIYASIGAGGTAYFSSPMKAKELGSLFSGFIMSFIEMVREKPEEYFDRIQWQPDKDGTEGLH